MQRTLAGTSRAAVLLMAAVAAGCGIESQEPPSLIGPSGFGQSVTISATPDRLPRDGTSQSVINVVVRNDTGQPVNGQRVTLGASAGTLSQADIVTGSDGRASATLTAPAPGSTGNTIEVFATPVSGNFDTAVTRSLSIAVVGLSNSTAPAPQFTVAPTAPVARETVTFDASGTTDEGAPCQDVCSYSWNFGDGTRKSGRIVTHSFASVGAYVVVLTVTDAAGTTATRQQTLTVTADDAPSVSIIVSPNPPIPGRPATFTASATVPAGRTVVRYSWDFGDGTTQETTSPSVTKTFGAANVYVVTVRATDDLGQVGTATSQITIRILSPTVTLTTAPNPPVAGRPASLSANASPAAGQRIAKFIWDFGDGSTAETQNSVVTHVYKSQGLFVAKVTVADDLGQTGSSSLSFTIVESSVRAVIVISPISPQTNQLVHFTALNPTAPDGATVASYEWNFGDSQLSNGGTASGQTVSKTYTRAGTFVVRLTVTDSNGVRGVYTSNVIVTQAAP